MEARQNFTRLVIAEGLAALVIHQESAMALPKHLIL